jgi:general secretion pathway protein A
MYQQFFRLRELPFELTPNPKYLFLPPQHREALSNLLYGLSSSKTITALIGEVGTGKTTLLHAALASEQCQNVGCVYLNNPGLTREEFVEVLAYRFGLSVHAQQSKSALLSELETILRERRGRGVISALVIDEAQSMSSELLEEIRLLGNIETSEEKLLPLVLAGQPELRQRLNEPGLRQLKQRITLRCEIGPFTLSETAAYMAFRIRTAGGEPDRIFTRNAVSLIHRFSGGIPRTISVMCDNALVTAFGVGRQPVDSQIVAGVARDFDFRGVDGVDAAASFGDDTSPAQHVSRVPIVPTAAAVPEVPSADVKPVVSEEPEPVRPMFSTFGRR